MRVGHRESVCAVLLVPLDCRRRHHLQALHNLRGSARAGLSFPLLAPLHHLPISAPASRSENARDHGGGGLHRRSRDLVRPDSRLVEGSPLFRSLLRPHRLHRVRRLRLELRHLRLPLPLCHRLQVLSAVRQRVVAGVVSHDHDRDGLARRVPVDRASQKSPKVAASRNHPPAVPAVPQLARISLLTHL